MHNNTACRVVFALIGSIQAAVSVWESGSPGARHGAGCTHSATLAAYLARGASLVEAAHAAAAAAGRACEHGLAEIGAGDGPVDVLDLKGAA